MDIQNTNVNSIIEKIEQESSRFSALSHEVAKIIVGQHEIIKFIIISILSNGHILLEGVPGVAKTTMIKAITKALGLTFKRIQFTPDLLPSDLIGTLIFNQKTNEFETRKGPIFANLILADEINRAPAKVQSALLEAMQERQVTIGSSTFMLDQPFLVFATQNPIEQEGTYRLPEAQVDRFMFKLIVNYPKPNDEKKILYKMNESLHIDQVLSKQDIFTAQKRVQQIYIDEKIVDYIVKIVSATRNPESCNITEIKHYIQCGASPRASIALYQASKAYAFLKKRHFVTPDDVKQLSPLVLNHRIMLTYEAESEGITANDITRKILSTLQSP